MNFEIARDKLGHKFANISEVSPGILKGIRKSGDRDVAAYVFDLNSNLPGTVGELSDYLDSVMGPIYFDSKFTNDLRWNSYLYFIVGNELKHNPDFGTYKRNLEADKNYARKFVVYEEDFDRVLKEIDSVESTEKKEVSADVIQIWSTKLSTINQEDILDVNRPIADIVRGIATGATKNTTRTKKFSGEELSKVLVDSQLANINLDGFRSHAGKKYFEGFGRANLIFGVNGVGKTSLLEGIEFLYCGSSKRSSLPENASVEGKLHSGKTVKTSVNQPLSDFKTRQRLWYGADDPANQNRLPNQFARFNFLNTDAAAEFTLLTGGKATENADSLATLLNGSEATSMWKRINDVSEAIKVKINSIKSERAIAITEKHAKDADLEKLKLIPQQSDSAFDILIKNLQHLCWKELPKSKNQITKNFTEGLIELTTKLSILNRIDWINAPLNLDAINREYKNLFKSNEDLKELLNAKSLNENMLYSASIRQSKVEESYSAISKIPSEALIDIFRISDELNQITEYLIHNSKLFTSLPDIESPDELVNRWGNLPLSLAISKCRSRLEEISDQVVIDTERHAEYIRAHSQIETAKRELKNWALKVMEHEHADAFCPACQTPFEPIVLMGRLEALSNSPIDSLLSNLSTEIDQKIELSNLLSKDLEWLTSLKEFTRFVPDNMDSVSVSDVQRNIINWKDRRTESQNTKHKLEKRLQDYKAVGIHLEDIHEACKFILEDESIKNNLRNTLAAKESANQIIAALQVEIESIEVEIQDSDSKIEQGLISLGMDPSDDVYDVLKQLAYKLMTLEQALSVQTVIQEFITLNSNQDLLSIYSAFENAILETKRLYQLIESDENHSSSVKSNTSEVEKLATRIEQYNASLKQLGNVNLVLLDIINNNSIQAASATIVEDTHEVADKIFRRIHTPIEYMISNQANAPLIRRADNAPFRLNQVSTGQRAAYALSMFLAMNAQVDLGPKLVLLDDPISHIDDLNALSFLDYLRNLVITSNRQIFFATADEKIAGLFAHKFAFLDKEFNTFELTRKKA